MKIKNREVRSLNISLMSSRTSQVIGKWIEGKAWDRELTKDVEQARQFLKSVQKGRQQSLRIKKDTKVIMHTESLDDFQYVVEILERMEELKEGLTYQQCKEIIEKVERVLDNILQIKGENLEEGEFARKFFTDLAQHTLLPMTPLK